MEEKVQYQSDERLQDVNDVLENCQTRVGISFIKKKQSIKNKTVIYLLNKKF